MSSTILSPENPIAPKSPLDLDQQRLELINDVSQVAEGARRTTWRRALFVWLGIVLLTGLVLVSLDLLLRQEDPLLRWALFLTFLSSASIAAWKVLRPAHQFDPDVQSVAGWIERSEIAHGEQLATAIRLSLLSSDDPDCGGQELRRLAMAKWFQLQKQPDWSEMVDHGSARRGLVALITLVGVVAIFAAISPASAMLGSMRLFLPFGDFPWPRADRLVLVDLPSAVALGSELQLEIMDENSPLPAAIDLVVREELEEGGFGDNRVYAANTLGEVAVASIPRVERPIEVRAIGGDDDSMPWRRIDVVRPPEIVEHEFRIVAPKYARIPDARKEQSQVSVLRGSRIQLVGRFNGQIEQLEAVSKLRQGANQSSAQGRSVDEMSCPLDDLAFSMGDAEGSWIAEETQRWQFRVHMSDGLDVELPRVWAVDVVPDRMPAILLEPPLLRSVSRDAQLRITGDVRDDLGLADVRIRIGFAPDMNSQTWAATMNVLYEQQLAMELDQQAEPVKEYEIRSTIDLSGVDVTEEQEFRLWVEAKDSFGQIARSSPQSYRVRSTEQVLEAIQKREEKIGERLREIVLSQRKNTQATNRIETLLRDLQQLDGELSDAMSDTTLIQKTILDQVENESSGLLGELRELSELLEQNGLDASPLASELSTMEEELTRISESSLDRASEASQDALLAARRRLADAASVPVDEELLNQQRAASEATQAALQDLLQLQGQRTRSATSQRMQSDLKRIIDDQQTLRDETQTLEIDSVKQPSMPALAAQSRVLGTDQSTLARELDRLVAELQEAENSGIDPETGSTSTGGIASEIVGLQISQRMRQAADFLTDEKTSSAIIQQDQVLAALREILTKLGSDSQDPSGNDFADRASKMQRAAEALSQLSVQQRALAKDIAEGNVAESEGFAEEQALLQQQVDEQFRQLSRSADRASTPAVSALESAIADQQRTRDELNERDMLSASASADRAADSLLEATNALDRNAQDMELQAQEQRVYRLEEEIDQLLQAQTPMVDEIAQLGAMMKKQAADVTDRVTELTAREEVVANRVEGLLADSDLEELANLPGFGWVLEQAFADLQRTVAALQRLRVRPEAEDSAAAALKKLELLKESLRQSATAQEESNLSPENQEAQNGQDEEAEGAKIPPLASLKLLRGVQEDINQRTIAINNGDQSEAMRELRLRELTQQQQALARQLQMLIEESSNR